MVELQGDSANLPATRLKTGSYRLSKSREVAEKYLRAIAGRMATLQADSSRMLDFLTEAADPASILTQEVVDGLYGEFCKTVVTTTIEVCKPNAMKPPNTVFATPELRQLRHDRRVLQKGLDTVGRVSEVRRTTVQCIRKMQKRIRKVTSELKLAKYQEFTGRIAMMDASEKMRVLKSMCRRRTGVKSGLDIEHIEEHAAHFAGVYMTERHTPRMEGGGDVPTRIEMAEEIFSDYQVARGANDSRTEKHPE